MIESCQCENRVYRYRNFQNGTNHYGTQCLNCGRWQAVKKSDVPLEEIKRMGEYDPVIAEDYDRRRSTAWKSQAEEQRQEALNALAEYYKTPEWHAKRRHRLELNRRLFGGLCECCMINRASDAHHVTYVRLYHEWMFDLAAVCEQCHSLFHPHMTRRAIGENDADSY